MSWGGEGSGRIGRADGSAGGWEGVFNPGVGGLGDWKQSGWVGKKNAAQQIGWEARFSQSLGSDLNVCKHSVDQASPFLI